MHRDIRQEHDLSFSTESHMYVVFILHMTFHNIVLKQLYRKKTLGYVDVLIMHLKVPPGCSQSFYPLQL